MKRAVAILVVGVASVAVALNANQRNTASLEAPGPAVRAALTRFLTAFENLDWDLLRASFDDDATAFFPTPEPQQRFEGLESRDVVEIRSAGRG